LIEIGQKFRKLVWKPKYLSWLAAKFNGYKRALFECNSIRLLGYPK